MGEFYDLSREMDEISAAMLGSAAQIRQKAPRMPIDLQLAAGRERGRKIIVAVTGQIDTLYLQIRERLDVISGCFAQEAEQGFSEPDPGTHFYADDQIVHITLPGMLPFKSSSYAAYVPRKLHTILERAVSEARIHKKPLPHFERAAVIFLHCVAKAQCDAGRLRDYDNLERKSVLDILRAYFFYSDNMRGLVTTDISAVSETSGTEVFVTEITGYRSFLDELETRYRLF